MKMSVLMQYLIYYVWEVLFHLHVTCIKKLVWESVGASIIACDLLICSYC